MRTQAEWNVAISGGVMPTGSSRSSTRRAISPAALLVNVIGEEVARVRARAAEQPGDAIGDDPRLAAAGAGQDEQRPVAGDDGLALGGVQIVEETLQRRGHHAIVPERDNF